MGGIYSKVYNDFVKPAINYNNYNTMVSLDNRILCEICNTANDAVDTKPCEYCRLEICDNCESCSESPYNNYILCSDCYINLYMGKSKRMSPSKIDP